LGVLATSDPKTEAGKLLSVASIRRRTGLSRKTIYRDIDRDDGPAKLTPVSGGHGRVYLFEPAEVERWIRER
jgi:predicted DNA-binding transcriptional regulator AlpA